MKATRLELLCTGFASGTVQRPSSTARSAMPTTVTTTTTVTKSGVTTTFTETTVDGVVAADTSSPVADEDFPRALADVTAAWISAVLKKEVVSFDTKALETGVLSDLGLLTLTYAAGVTEPSPPSIVVKFCKVRVQKGACHRLHAHTACRLAPLRAPLQPPPTNRLAALTACLRRVTQLFARAR